MGVIDRHLRSVAYDILSLRDQVWGWKPARTAFLTGVGNDASCHARNIQIALQKILLHAYDSCPYYRRSWEQIRFMPSPRTQPKDLANLPFLTKEIIKANKRSMLSNRVPFNQLDMSYTGGTTGTQTSFYLDRECRVARIGRQWGMLQRFGYRPGTRRALVWGVHDDLPTPGLSGGVKAWFRRYATGQETLCCVVMSEPEMMAFHKKLLRFRPDIMYGYPSALLEFARFIQDQSLEPVRVQKTITTAELLDTNTRRQLSEAFSGEVFNLYATREHGCIGFECDRHSGFHIDTGSVFMEIVDGTRAVEPGESGEIVITDLLNYGMPFIRSRTGDIGVLSERVCECGSCLPLLANLEGRISNLLYRPDGSVVPGLMLSDLFKELSAIRAHQIIQETLDQIDVLLVITGGFCESVRAQVLRQVREIMGEEVSIAVRLVSDIARNPRSGKIQEVICKVSRPSEASIVRAKP